MGSSSSSSTSSSFLFRYRSSILLCVFILTLCIVVGVLRSFPTLSSDEWAKILRFPPRLKDLSQVVERYRTDHFGSLLGAFVLVYLFLQSFAIPGAIVLSLLAGPLFGVWFGLLVVSCSATCGASICYILSYFLGRNMVKRCFPVLLEKMRGMIHRHRHNLFFYLLFLRISPLLPNWFINIASPLLDVPLPHFFAATLIGLIPANYLHITTGIQIEELGNEMEGAQGPSLQRFIFLFAIAFVALIPTIFRSQFEKADENMNEQNNAAATSNGDDSNGNDEKHAAHSSSSSSSSSHALKQRKH